MLVPPVRLRGGERGPRAGGRWTGGRRIAAFQKSVSVGMERGEAGIRMGKEARGEWGRRGGKKGEEREARR